MNLNKMIDKIQDFIEKVTTAEVKKSYLTVKTEFFYSFCCQRFEQIIWFIYYYSGIQNPFQKSKNNATLLDLNIFKLKTKKCFS